MKVGPTIFKYLSGADVESQYHEEIYRMTIIDGLTQVHNKRYLYEALEREIIRARRHARELSFLMFDIDHFKKINDVHGHLAGDFVLKELARIVQGRIRRDEVFARYGGEEFAIVLPETDLEGAARARRQHAREDPRAQLRLPERSDRGHDQRRRRPPSKRPTRRRPISSSAPTSASSKPSEPAATAFADNRPICRTGITLLGMAQGRRELGSLLVLISS